ncbi:MAG: HEAT repeat domain-containing protein [Deltaproteobacteria bacterium]|nr:HEAT repeat domain-containing protein [Deltaproteobacteria bacterium]
MLFPEEVVSNISLEIYLLSDPLLYNRLSFSVLLYLAHRLEKEDNSIKVKLIGNAILSQWLNNITISLSSMEANIIFPVLQIKCDALLNRLILTTDRTILQTVARNFFLSEDQLSYLSNCTFPPIRALVAAHPNLGVETIRKLSDDKSSSVRTAIVKHPKISHELLERFSQDKDIDVRIAVARHSNTTAEILSRLMNDPDEKVRAAVARNPNTSSADLDLLSQDSNREVKSAADSNPGIRFERLSKISAQGRVSIAANEKNLLGLALLENDSEIEVRKALVLNPHLPLVQVIRMKEKGDLFFRQHMAAFIHLPEVLDVLGNDPDLTVRKNVISNGHTSLETLTRMTQTSDSQMRRYIAIHVRFPEILDSLGNDPDPEVRKNVISKWHTSLETLTRMTQDSDLQIRRHIALHVRFPEILDILGDDLDHEVRRNVLSNAHVTLKTFRKTVLGVDPESRRYIAWQTKNNEMLAILSSDPDLEVKERVADNRNTSLETLKRMTQDPDPKLRQHMEWRKK